jgi:PAS domain S-box-containing protein
MPDGTLKYVQLVGHAVHDEAGSLEFIGSMVDITAAKEAEKKIQRIIDTVPAFIWTTRADGSLDFISQRCLDYDGLTLEKSIKLGWGAQVHPDDREDSRAKWDAARTSGTHFEAEARFRRFDGEYRWFLSRAYPLVDHAGQVLGWYGNDTDIHDRKLAEQKLAQSEAFLAEAQRLSKTGSFSRNVATGDLVWSEEMFRLFEYDPATTPTIDLVLGRIHPDDKQFMRQIIEGAAQGSPELDEEYRLLMPDGSVKYMRNLRVAAQAQGDGGLTVVGTVMDVTERKLAEEALRKAQLELAHVARVTTFGEFAASIAHEVNQPLAAIVTNGEVCLRLLGRDPPDLVEVRQATEDVIRDGRRASEIIRRLRALTKKTEPEKLPLDVNDVITGVIPLVRQEMLINRVWLRLELAPHLPRIRGDRVQLEQVIVNLVANAIDAMASGTEGVRELVISSRQDERDRAVISVRDSGQGIDPGIAGRLFDAFFTTKPSGMGMGLSICRSIIENHGGSLSASSNDGQLGATFRFTLPLVEEAVH